MPNKYRKSTFFLIFKNERDSNSIKLHGIKLMDHTMNIWESVINHELSDITNVSENQFSDLTKECLITNL